MLLLLSDPRKHLDRRLHFRRQALAAGLLCSVGLGRIHALPLPARLQPAPPAAARSISQGLSIL